MLFVFILFNDICQHFKKMTEFSKPIFFKEPVDDVPKLCTHKSSIQRLMDFYVTIWKVVSIIPSFMLWFKEIASFRILVWF